MRLFDSFRTQPCLSGSLDAGGGGCPAPLLRVVCVGCCWLGYVTCAGRLPAQQITPSVDESPPTTPLSVPVMPDDTPASDAAVRPDTYLLPDGQGKLQKVLGFDYATFVEAWKRHWQIDTRATAPNYTLREFSAEGIVSEGMARLKVVYEVGLRQERLTRVPLGLGNAALMRPVEWSWEGEHFLVYDDERKELAAWLRGPSSEPGQISLDVVVPLDNPSPTPKLRLSVPRATQSRLGITVPDRDASATTSNGAVLTATREVAQGTQFDIAGVGRDFVLRWLVADRAAATLPPALEAQGAITARVDQSAIQFEARLTVKSLAGPIHRVQIVLPQDAQLIAVENADLAVQVRQTTTSSGGQRPVIEVRTDSASTGPLEIPLVVKQPMADPARTLEVSGFVVRDAVRQSGRVTMLTSADWDVLWTAQEAARRVEDATADVRTADVDTAFEYFRQPFRIRGRLKPRVARLTITQRNQLRICADEAFLELRLHFRQPDRQLSVLEVQTDGWRVDLDRVEPAEVFDLEFAAVDPSGVLALPLRRPLENDLEITLPARRNLPADSTHVELPIPTPRGVRLAGATLLVVPDSNLELVPDRQALKNLTRYPDLFDDSPENSRRSFFYRVGTYPAVFVAERHLRPRMVSVNLNSEISYRGEKSRIGQQYEYRVENDPLEEIVLEIPSELKGHQGLEVTLDGERLAAGEPEQLATSPDSPGDGRDNASAPDSPQRVRYALPESRTGTFRLRVVYGWSASWDASEPVPMRVPLVQPAEADVVRNVVHVTAGPQIRVEPTSSPSWQLQEPDSAPSGSSGGLRLVSAGPVGPLELQVTETRRAIQGCYVERMWMQSRLSDVERQDRVVFRLHSSVPSRRLFLPPDVVSGTVRLWIDGREITDPVIEPFERTLTLAGLAADTPTQVELVYATRGGTKTFGPSSLAPPRFEGDNWIRQMYWQVALPADKHVVKVDERFTSENAWQWTGFGFARVANLSTQQLQQWSGGHTASSLPMQSHHYLFSYFGGTHSLTLWTASRSSIVLVASGVALAVGLLLIYVPASRRPASLLAGVVVLIAGGWRYPEEAFLIGQSAVLGVVLTLVAVRLKKIVSRPVVTPQIPAAGSSVVVNTYSTEPFAQGLPASGSSASTKVGFAPVSDPPS